MYCQKCGQLIQDDSKFCAVCGAPQGYWSDGGVSSGAAGTQAPPMNAGASAMAQSEANPRAGLVIACLILGIASILVSFIGYTSFGVLALIPLAAGIIGLIFAVIAHKHGNNSGLRTAGFICSIIGIVLSSISLIVGISWAIMIDQTAKQIERAAEEYTNGVFNGVEKGVENAVDEYMNSITDYLNDLEDAFK